MSFNTKTTYPTQFPVKKFFLIFIEDANQESFTVYRGFVVKLAVGRDPLNLGLRQKKRKKRKRKGKRDNKNVVGRDPRAAEI